MRVISTSACFLCIASMMLGPSTLIAQTAGPVTSPTPAATQETASASPNTLVDGTPVKLRLSETVSSSEAKTGQQIPFEVIEDVQVQGVTVIAKGSTAVATVTAAEHKKSMGRGGKLDIAVESVRLVDNEKAQLRASAGGKGGGHTGAMTGAIVATSIVFFPAAPLFLFIHGKDITLAKGLETTAFTEGNMRLNLAAFSNAGQPFGTPVLASVAAGLSQVSIDASVADCDISVDGAFVGSTPSQVTLPTGQHAVTVHKEGYTDWTRTLAVSGAAVRLHADLLPAIASK